MRKINDGEVYICKTESEWDTLKQMVISTNRKWFIKTVFIPNICVKIYYNRVTTGPKKYFIKRNIKILLMTLNYEIY